MTLNAQESLELSENPEGLVANDVAKSTLVSRNITVIGHRTSVRLESEMWMALREIAKRERCSIHDICTLIHMRKMAGTSLTAAIRVFLMLYFRAASTEEGHGRAGHGNFEQMRGRARLPESYFPILKRHNKSPVGKARMGA